MDLYEPLEQNAVEIYSVQLLNFREWEKRQQLLEMLTN